MSNSKLIELSYYDPSAQVRLSAYADTLVLDHDQNGSIIRAIRFGGYPEMVRAMADAIYGGATIEAAQNDTTRMLQSSLKSYQRQITHDGIYAVATLMAADFERLVKLDPASLEYGLIKTQLVKNKNRINDALYIISQFATLYMKTSKR